MAGQPTASQLSQSLQKSYTQLSLTLTQAGPMTRHD